MKKENENQSLSSDRWYVVNTAFQAERLAKCHLERIRGIEVYLPVRAAAPRSKTATVPFLPNYLFVCPDPAAPRWNDIYTALGVRQVLGVGGKPSVAPIGLVPRIRAHEVDGVVHVERKKAGKLPFNPGDKVRIKAGQFMGFDALFEVGDQQRVIVLLGLFGRQTRVELSPEDLAQVCAPAADAMRSDPKPSKARTSTNGQNVADEPKQIEDNRESPA